MGSVEDESGPSNEICTIYDGAGNEEFGFKVEEASDTIGDFPQEIIFPKLKIEREVRL